MENIDIIKPLSAKQQALISELVQRNLILETYVEMLQAQLKQATEELVKLQVPPAGATANEGN